MSILARFRFINSSPRAGLLALAVAVGVTLIWVQILGGTSTIRNLWSSGSTTEHITIDPTTGVKLNAKLSQPKIVQGSDGTVYLDLKVVTPDSLERRSSILPSDIPGRPGSQRVDGRRSKVAICHSVDPVSSGPVDPFGQNCLYQL